MYDKDTHPLISLYGETEKKQFPLVLVIGREPNDPGKKIGHHIGYYCHLTKKDSNCKTPHHVTRTKNVPFWDVSYSLFAETAGTSGMKLKEACVSRNSSPVAYADISPITTSKDGKRTRCSHHEYLRHLEEISKSTLFANNRVEIVVFSGLKWPTWAKNWYGSAVDAFQGEVKDIVSVNVPFFVGNNRQRIQKMLYKEKAKVRSIIKRWDVVEAPPALLLGN